jgi:hypothetical protein
VDVNAVGKEGKTALHYAIQAREDITLKALAGFSADAQFAPQAKTDSTDISLAKFDTDIKPVDNDREIVLGNLPNPIWIRISACFTGITAGYHRIRQWNIHGMQNFIERQFWPVVPPGYRRIEWICVSLIYQ